MVAVPMTPAAPVTTATLPSRRIRSGMWFFPVVSWFFRLSRIGDWPRRICGATVLPRRLFHAADKADQSRRRRATRPFPAVFGVLTGWPCERLIKSVQCRQPDLPFKAARDVSNHCPDWFCGPCRRLDDLACAAGARADRQYLFRSGAAAARQHSARQSAAAGARRRRRSAGAAAGPAAADPQPSAPPGQGCSAAGLGAVAAVGAAAGYHRRSAKHAAGHRRRAAAARPGRRRSHAAAAPIRCRDCRPATPARRACRRRRRRCSPATRSSPSRRRRRSSTRRRASPASTRSPAASSISTRISARPCSSARCG